MVKLAQMLKQFVEGLNRPELLSLFEDSSNHSSGDEEQYDTNADRTILTDVSSLNVSAPPTHPSALIDAANLSSNSRLQNRVHSKGKIEMPKLNVKGENQLHRACMSGNLRRVMSLVNDSKFPVNYKDHAGWSALHESCRLGHKEIVDFLIQNNADVNAQGDQGKTPLIYAALMGHLDIVEVLLANNASPLLRMKDGYTVLDAFDDWIRTTIKNKKTINCEQRQLYYNIRRKIERIMNNSTLYPVVNRTLQMSEPLPGTSEITTKNQSNKVDVLPEVIKRKSSGLPMPASKKIANENSRIHQDDDIITSKVGKRMVRTNSRLHGDRNVSNVCDTETMKDEEYSSPVHPSQCSKVKRSVLIPGELNESDQADTGNYHTPIKDTPSSHRPRRKSTYQTMNKETPITTRKSTRPMDSNSHKKMLLQIARKECKGQESLRNLRYEEIDRTHTTIAEMAARDGISLQLIGSSKTLRELLIQAGYESIPMSLNDVKTMILTKSDQLKNVVKNNIIKEDFKMLSLTLDEYISRSNRQYLNINIHTTNDENYSQNYHFNLGLVRLKQENTTNDYIHNLKERLVSFGVSLDKVMIFVTTNNTSSITDMLKIDTNFKQLCIVEGIRTAVLEVLYNKENSTISLKDNISQIDRTKIDEKLGILDEDDSEIDESFNDNYIPILNSSTSETHLIEKIRRVLTFMKGYTNDVETKNLILNCDNNWSALTDLLDKFIKLENEVPITAKEKRLNPETSFTKRDIKALKDLWMSLDCIRETVKILYKIKNMVQTEAALKYMIGTLNTYKTYTSKQLYTKISQTIKERRNVYLFSAINYLHDPEFNIINKFQEKKAKSNSDFFPNATNSAIREYILNISKELFSNELFNNKLINRGDTLNKSYAENLKAVVFQHIHASPYSQSTLLSSDKELLEKIEYDMREYENGKEKSVYLKRVYNYLMSIPSKSISQEKAFSTKKFDASFNCSYKDDTLDALSFLRFYLTTDY